jgi:hypothetical protein
MNGIDFAVVGTYNLYLQGVNIVPNDLDFITDDEPLGKVGKIFGSEITVNESGYKETEFKFNNTDIHLVSNINNKLRPPFRDNIVWLQKEDLKIPCMSLESELLFYEKINREKDMGKVELIGERIRKK